MDIAKIVILDEDKLERKHDVYGYEAEEVLLNKPRFFFAQQGNVEGEDVYRALGRTEEGRYLVVFFAYKRNRSALVLSARDMTDKKTLCQEIKFNATRCPILFLHSKSWWVSGIRMIPKTILKHGAKWNSKSRRASGVIRVSHSNLKC